MDELINSVALHLDERHKRTNFNKPNIHPYFDSVLGKSLFYNAEPASFTALFPPIATSIDFPDVLEFASKSLSSNSNPTTAATIHGSLLIEIILSKLEAPATSSAVSTLPLISEIVDLILHTNTNSESESTPSPTPTPTQTSSNLHMSSFFTTILLRIIHHLLLLSPPPPNAAILPLLLVTATSLSFEQISTEDFTPVETLGSLLEMQTQMQMQMQIQMQTHLISSGNPLYNPKIFSNTAATSISTRRQAAGLLRLLKKVITRSGKEEEEEEEEEVAVVAPELNARRDLSAILTSSGHFFLDSVVMTCRAMFFGKLKNPKNTNPSTLPSPHSNVTPWKLSPLTLFGPLHVLSSALFFPHVTSSSLENVLPIAYTLVDHFDSSVQSVGAALVCRIGREGTETAVKGHGEMIESVLEIGTRVARGRCELFLLCQGRARNLIVENSHANPHKSRKIISELLSIISRCHGGENGEDVTLACTSGIYRISTHQNTKSEDPNWAVEVLKIGLDVLLPLTRYNANSYGGSNFNLSRLALGVVSNLISGAKPVLHRHVESIVLCMIMVAGNAKKDVKMLEKLDKNPERKKRIEEAECVLSCAFEIAKITVTKSLRPSLDEIRIKCPGLVEIINEIELSI